LKDERLTQFFPFKLETSYLPHELQKRERMTLVTATKRQREFDPKAFLATIDSDRKIAAFSRKQMIFVQGDTCDSVFYIQKGKVKLTVLSKAGKEATLGILDEGSFFGESCLHGQPVRLCSATALTDCSVMRIEKKAMMEVLHREHAFSDMFVAYLLTRTVRYEEDLVDQLFNSSEKRLARILLLLANFGKEGKHELAIPKISQETLAEMVGTTRSRVSFFMNRFRRLGFVQYNGKLEVHSSLLNIILHD
jgi:CRP/FNR family cyclic AMP-dependent transcriptional regulator